jgi:hypothetical protein
LTPLLIEKIEQTLKLERVTREVKRPEVLGDGAFSETKTFLREQFAGAESELKECRTHFGLFKKCRLNTFEREEKVVEIKPL